MNIKKDTEWVRQAFLVTAEDLAPLDLQNRFFTSASLKYTDTSPGGNFAINPPPQFTRYADLKAQGRFQGNNQSVNNGARGMGRYYSEAIDDNSQIIHLRFGVPQFNSMTSFFSSFYNSGAGQLARTGRADSAFYQLGKAAALIVSVMSWRLLAIGLLGIGVKFLMAKPSSKFYFLKPTMPLYWNAVTTMVNQLGVNRGIIPRVGDPNLSAIDGGFTEDNAKLCSALHNLLPEIFTDPSKASIDVYAMANRAQRLARKNDRLMQEALNNGTSFNMETLSRRIQQINDQKLTDQRQRNFNTPMTGSDKDDSYLGLWFSSQVSKPDPDENPPSDNASDSATPAAPAVKENPADKRALTEENTAGFLDFLTAELDDGAAFATFRVNSTGPVNESFSNSVGESDLQQKINGMSSSSRSTSFSFAGGNLMGGVIGETVGAAVGAVKSFAQGVGEGLQISGLAALGGSALVDIPKTWQSSSASLPRASYTIDLVSPYGNPISQLINIYIPLCMLLAGALPMSTGKQSYTSPFICELYDKGRCQTRLGMIDSLSVTRGVGNLGYNNEGHAMGIQVTFSVIDMSSILHMPITQGFKNSATGAFATIGGAIGTLIGAGAGSVAGPVGTVAGGVAGGAAGTVGGAAVGAGVDAINNAVTSVNQLFAEDTSFSDYMAVIAGMGLADQIYQLRKLRLNMAREMQNWNSFYSASQFAGFVGDTMPGRLVSAFYKGTKKD